MMNTDALKELMESLNKLFGSEMEDDSEDEDKSAKPAKGKKITIVTIGKGKPEGGLKIPKKKKQPVEEMDDE